MKPDFSGYATKNDLQCSDGKTIIAGAFKHNDKQKVPLVWQHQHNSPLNVLGHAMLENRPDGVYAYGYFNTTQAGKDAKIMVAHKDVSALSIYANNLKQRGNSVLHGDIREVSLVLSGANPGAFIDNISIQHGDTYETLEDEAVIYTGLTLEHADTQADTQGDTVATEDTQDQTEDQNEKTVKDVFDSMSEEQKNVVYFMLGEALESKGEDEDEDDEDDDEDGEVQHSNIIHSIQEGFENIMTRNVFEQNAAPVGDKNTLSHAQINSIVDDAKKYGSFKDSFLAHAAEYGIENIDFLFPDARTVNNSPDLISRQVEWVQGVLAGTKHSPFSRIKSLAADLTAEEARAKGYIKGKMKKEEVIKLLRRTTTPTTVYKKQKLDRDDVIDITDLDIVAWLKAEIRLMLNEELARAILVGDGRSSASEDKIKDPEGAIDGVGIRSIYHDSELYAHKIQLTANISPEATIEAISRSRSKYKGTGQPTLYTTDPVLTDMLLLKDKVGRRLYDTEEALASVLRVSKIVSVEVFEETPELLGIMVNLSDYTIGADKGGELSFFEDFDIDFNQHKYLLETRVSGALTRPKSAVIIKRAQGTQSAPTSPSFDGGTNTITIPSTTGVLYTIDEEVVTGEVEILEDTTVVAVPDEEYYFVSNITTEWSFTFTEV